MTPREAEEARRRLHLHDPALHGSARWATRAHLKARGYGPGGRFLFGYAPPDEPGTGPYAVTYSGARHMLTCAPNRSGKGITTCIPSLLSHTGSAVVLDPRGEIACATARFREQALGQRVFVYDPFNIACPHLDRNPDRFNVLDAVRPESPTFFDDALLVADALVMEETYGSRFWADEARALIAGLILQVAYDPREIGTRHVGRVRDILNLPGAEMRGYIGGLFEQDDPDEEPRLVQLGMVQSPNPFVRAAAGRILSKPERQFGDILSTAHQNTHVLESAPVRHSLSASDFDFASIGAGDMTVYLVLPPERLRTHGRLLRLLVSAAIDAINRLRTKPDPPCLFMLDEMGAIGRLDALIAAFGVLAGSGMQLHPIFQDFAQAKSLYGERWQTFIANAAVIQAFGTRDLLTAEYLSKLCGVGTAEHLTYESAMRRRYLLGDPTYTSREDARIARPLVTPDEIMTMHPATQLLVLANASPIVCFRAPYFLDSRFRGARGRPWFDVPPRYKDNPLPRPITFTAPGRDLFRALSPYLTVG